MMQLDFYLERINSNKLCVYYFGFGAFFRQCKSALPVGLIFQLENPKYKTDRVNSKTYTNPKVLHVAALIAAAGELHAGRCPEES